MSIVSLLNNVTALRVSALVNPFFCYLMAAVLLYEINDGTIRWMRASLFGAIMAMVASAPRLFYYDILMALGIPDSSLMAWVLNGLFAYRNPVWLLLCALSAVWVLGLPWRSIRRQLVVIFCGCQMLVYIGHLVDFVYRRLVQDIRFDTTARTAHYIYLVVELTHVATTAIWFAACLALRRYIHTHRNRIKVFAEGADGAQANMAWISALIIAIWLANMGFGLVDELAMDTYTHAVELGYILALLIIGVLAIHLDYSLKIKDARSRNHAEATRLMLETIDDFRGIKHDFNNILQTYDGYFALEDYDGLRRYHETLRDKTIMAGERLALQATFAEKPALLGLIGATTDKAEALGVRFTFLHLELLGAVTMADIDLCRVLSNLLNNAIEHAAQTEDRAVSFSVQRRSRDRGIVIVSNSVDEAIDTADLFREGFTTKPGHAGHGLAEVNRILARYYGCTILPSCVGRTFSMYLNVTLAPAVTCAC